MTLCMSASAKAAAVLGSVQLLGNFVGVDDDAWDATLLGKRSIMKTAVLEAV